MQSESTRVVTKIIIVIAIIIIPLGYWLLRPALTNDIVMEEIPVVEDVIEKDVIDEESKEVFEQKNDDSLEINYEKEGSFEGRANHSGEGTVKLVKSGNDYYIRFEEDFKTDNAPDMFVHLGKDGEYNKELNFGKLKGNIGSQNYKIEDISVLEDHNEVWVWCRAFSVPMGVAELK